MERNSSSRKDKIKRLVDQRQMDVQLILDRVHDMHNIGAVVRTCDAVGIAEVDLVMDQLRRRRKMRMGNLTTAGARKWVRVYAHNSPETAMHRIQWANTRQVVAATWHPQAVSLYDVDLTLPTTLIMGNEHDGVQKSLLDQADHIVAIPQRGMVESLNISVACAVILYELLRQREQAGQYDGQVHTPRHQALLERYQAEHNKSVHGYVRVYKEEE